MTTAGDTWRGFVAGSLAAIVAGCVTHPIDLVKVRMQLNASATQTPTIVGTTLAVVRQEGILALYDGITGSMLRQFVLIGTRLGFYNVFRKAFEGPDGRISFTGKLGCGLLAGAAGALLGNPADLALVRMQADGRLPLDRRRNYRHAGDAVVRIAREEGVRALWRGTTSTTARAMIVTAAQMACYEQSKEALMHRFGVKDSIPVHIAASLVAGLVAAVSSNPFDVAKTRLQDMVVGSDGRMPYRNMFHCMSRVTREEGGRALYKGFTATWARQAPLNVVRFVCLEQLNQLFGRIGYARVILGTPRPPALCPHGVPSHLCAECLTVRSHQLMGHTL
jgi:solute carrier family 25 oxoglutarate transporter 11